MAVNPLIFKNSEKVRDSITESQKKEIANLYNDWANEIGKMAEYYARKETSSAPVSERYYRELQKQLRTTSQEVSNEVYKKIRGNMYTVSDAVVADNVNWLKQFGFSEDGLNAAFSYVPDSVVRSIVTGQVYESGWSLSERIWGNNEQTMKDLYRIVAGGVAQQMPIKDISKQLEQYVRPGAAKQWNLVDKDGRKIYPRQVDYNAQRLARTLVQHSYQQSFDAVNRKNPFVTDYIWNANGSRVCELCLSRDGQHFKKDELPLDHPNGMCTMEPNVDINMEDKLVEWFNSEDGTFPEIDEFAKNFGYVPNNSSIKQNKQNVPDKKRDKNQGEYGQNALGHKYTKEEYEERLRDLNEFSKYHYHATTQRGFEGIKKDGINPSPGHAGTGVYFAKTEDSAKEWTADTSTGGQIVLRVKNTYLAKTDYMDFDRNKDGEGSTDFKIPIKEVEVKTSNGEWIPIKDAVTSWQRGKPSIIKRPKR